MENGGVRQSHDITPLLRSSATVVSVGQHVGDTVSALVLVVARDTALFLGVAVGVGLAAGVFVMTPFVTVEASVNHGAFPHIMIIPPASKTLGSLLLWVSDVGVVELMDAGFHNVQCEVACGVTEDTGHKSGVGVSTT